MKVLLRLASLGRMPRPVRVDLLAEYGGRGPRRHDGWADWSAYTIVYVIYTSHFLNARQMGNRGYKGNWGAGKI